jgi:hypothetical protein
LLASFKVVYKIVECKKETHSIGERLVLPCATDVVEVVLDESYAKEPRKIPLADTLCEEGYRVYRKTAMINSLISLKPDVLHCNQMRQPM